jgi:hypothetical protein
MEKLSMVHTKMLNCLQEKMWDFHFKIQYIKGEENSVTDYLFCSARIGCAPINESPASWWNLQWASPRPACGLQLWKETIQLDPIQ